MGVGVSLTGTILIRSIIQYQMNPLIAQEDVIIAIIGVTLGMAWYFPFFIVSYYMYRKYLNNRLHRNHQDST